MLAGDSLKNKVVIVTGGAVGVGEAVSRKFAALGDHVVIHGLPGDPVPELTTSLKNSNGSVSSYIGDVAVESHAEECVHKTVEKYGRLDVLVNLAGSALRTKSTEQIRVTDFDQLVYVNIRPVFLMTRFALPYLKRSRGVILSSGSRSGGIGSGLNPAHGAMKAWIHAFMKGVAAENAEHGIRANSVCHGAVIEDWNERELDLDPELEHQLVASTPMRRRGSPEEIANVYAFLASEDASFVTGAMYTVDGGLAMGPVIGPLGSSEIGSSEINGVEELHHRNEGLDV